MKKEIDALEKNGTWTFTSLPVENELLTVSRSIASNTRPMVQLKDTRQGLWFSVITKLKGSILPTPFHQWQKW